MTDREGQRGTEGHVRLSSGRGPPGRCIRWRRSGSGGVRGTRCCPGSRSRWSCCVGQAGETATEGLWTGRGAPAFSQRRRDLPGGPRRGPGGAGLGARVRLQWAPRLHPRGWSWIPIPRRLHQQGVHGHGAWKQNRVPDGSRSPRNREARGHSSWGQRACRNLS